MMTDAELLAQYQTRHDAECEAGGSIEINRSADYIAIRLSDGAEYFFSEWQAHELLAKVPESFRTNDLTIGIYLLASAQNW